MKYKLLTSRRSGILQELAQSRELTIFDPSTETTYQTLVKGYTTDGDGKEPQLRLEVEDHTEIISSPTPTTRFAHIRLISDYRGETTYIVEATRVEKL